MTLKRLLTLILSLGFTGVSWAGQSSLLNVSGSVTTSSHTAVVAAVTRRRITVTSFSLISRSTVPFTAAFQDGTSGTQKWGVELVSSSTSAVAGANLAVPHKQGGIFSTSVGSLLNLNIVPTPSQAVTYSIGYVEED